MVLKPGGHLPSDFSCRTVGNAGSGHYKLQCHQWRQSWHHEDPGFSVIVAQQEYGHHVYLNYPICRTLCRAVPLDYHTCGVGFWINPTECDGFQGAVFLIAKPVLVSRSNVSLNGDCDTFQGTPFLVAKNAVAFNLTDRAIVFTAKLQWFLKISIHDDDRLVCLCRSDILIDCRCFQWAIFHTPTIGVASTEHYSYRKTSNISRTLVGSKIVDNSDVVGASPVGAAPTTSSFST